MKKLCQFFLLLICSNRLFAQNKDADVPLRLSIDESNKSFNYTKGDTLATAFDNRIYYAHNEYTKDGTVHGILISRDKAQINRLSDNFSNKDEDIPAGKIVQMLINPSTHKLYYTVQSKEVKGIGVYMTMEYDLVTHQCRAYRDGILENIDAEGKQTVYYYGIDNIGAYKNKNVFNAEGRLVQSFDKEYVSTSSH